MSKNKILLDNIVKNGLEGRKTILQPLDKVGKYDIRPGIYELNGATALPCGVNFTVHSHNAKSCELLLFKKRENKPYASIRFPDHYRIGDVFSMVVFGLKIDEFEYAYRFDGPYDPENGLIFDKSKYILDPYAKAVTGQNVWGRKNDGENFQYKARVVRNNFNWVNLKSPNTPMKDIIIYEMHVRGFTRHKSSGVKYPGTFEGLMEKIPYLKSLGINAVELMPIFEFDEMSGSREIDGNSLIDYWGYNPVCFFAPNTSYTAKIEENQEGTELKKLIKKLNENGIKVILDVVFNHTAEGDKNGPFFSFKGIDNNIYYMLTPDGNYYNFSGCGNTLNCNHPIVREMILDCLRYWVINYKIDGFRFDLATILGRNKDSSPINNPPLLETLAADPILGNIYLIAEAWDAGGLYKVGSFSDCNRWAEWNGKYRDDLRSFLKGDPGFARAAAQRIVGSKDLYSSNRGDNVSVNFITCHDGFTLNDLYSYNYKHNEANGWNNTDGTNDNRSWNCGEEGETQNYEILKLRKRMIKNAFAVLLCSRGTPMFLAGDEFRNTQFGNNNPYCQDNEISWLDWSLLEKNKDIFEFVKFMISFRKKHDIIRGATLPSDCHYPDISFHGTTAWNDNYTWDTHEIGVMFAGKNKNSSKDDIIYIAINSFWEKKEFELPNLKNNYSWDTVINTYKDNSIINYEDIITDNKYILEPRSVAIFEAKEIKIK